MAIKHYRLEDCREWAACAVCDAADRLLAARKAAKKKVNA